MGTAGGLQVYPVFRRRVKGAVRRPWPLVQLKSEETGSPGYMVRQDWRIIILCPRIGIWGAKKPSERAWRPRTAQLAGISLCRQILDCTWRHLEGIQAECPGSPRKLDLDARAHLERFMTVQEDQLCPGQSP